MWDAPTIVALATLVSSVGAVAVSIIAALKATAAAERSGVAAMGSQNNNIALIAVKDTVKVLETKTSQLHDAVNGQTKELKEAIYKTGLDAGKEAGIAAERRDPQISATR